MDLKPRSATVKGPAEWFTGEVYIDTVTSRQDPSPMSVGLVHFAPGARTAWHCHGGGQTLYVTEGEGRVQSRGDAVHTIRPGDVVHTPADEWHWHGAAPDRLMVHLSIAEGQAEWGEHVAEDDYRS